MKWLYLRIFDGELISIFQKFQSCITPKIILEEKK